VLLAALLAATLAFAHWPVLHAQAVGLDDPSFVVQNPLVAHPGAQALRRVWTEALHPSTVSAYWTPLSMTSLMLDVALGARADRQLLFHATSLVLHVVGVELLFLLLVALGARAWAAAGAALLVGVHPLMVEAVASAGERKTVLSTALALAAALAHVRFARTRSRAAYGATLALFALALLTKPSVTTLPLVLLVLDAWPLRRFSPGAILEKWPHALLAIAGGAIASIAVRNTWEFGAPPPLAPGHRLLQLGWVLSHDASKLLWPLGLSTVYATPEPLALSQAPVALGLAGALALGALAVALRRRAPELLAGLAIFALLLSPTLGILRWGGVVTYDRYVGPPLAGLALTLAFALTRAASAHARAIRAVAAGAVLLVATGEVAATRVALRAWRDSVALWKQAVRISPGAPEAHNGLGATYSDAHRPAIAIAEFERAIALGPDYSDAHQNLGRELVLAGRVSEALPQLAFAAGHSPGSASAALQLGVGLQAAGRLGEAGAQYRRALALRPGYAPAIGRLGTVLVLEGRAGEGLPLLREAVALSPDEPRARYALAGALASVQGPNRESETLMRDVTRALPDFAPPFNDLAWMLATAPDPTLRDAAEALRLAARAVALAPPGDPATLDTQAAALASAGRCREAAALANRAAALAAEAHADTLAASIRGRATLYATGRAYVQPARP